MTSESKSLYVLESRLKRIEKISIYTYLMKFSGIFKHRSADHQQWRDLLIVKAKIKKCVRENLTLLNQRENNWLYYGVITHHVVQFF